MAPLSHHPSRLDPARGVSQPDGEPGRATPGPGAYDVLEARAAVERRGTPLRALCRGVGFGSGTPRRGSDDWSRAETGPGPGEYDTAQSVRDASPKRRASSSSFKSLTGRFGIELRPADATPGPGAYSPRHTSSPTRRYSAARSPGTS